jgi:hypothetical protein
MARIQTIVCDRCGAKDDSGPVLPWEVKRGSRKLTGDLCETCWDGLIKTYRPQQSGRKRHQVVVTEMSDIRR